MQCRHWFLDIIKPFSLLLWYIKRTGRAMVGFEWREWAYIPLVRPNKRDTFMYTMGAFQKGMVRYVLYLNRTKYLSIKIGLVIWYVTGQQARVVKVNKPTWHERGTKILSYYPGCTKSGWCYPPQEITIPRIAGFVVVTLNPIHSDLSGG